MPSPDSQLFDKLECGLVHVDHDCLITGANEVLEKWLNLDKDQIQGAPITSIFTRGAALFWETVIDASVRAQGHAWDVAIELKHGAKQVGVVANVAQINGEFVLVLFRFDDRRRYEKAMLELETAKANQAKELEAVKAMGRMRQDFINAAAHEIATPLTPMLMRITSLKKTVGETSPDAAKTLDSLEQSAQRLHQFARKLRDAGRVEFANFEPNFTALDLRVLVDSVAQDLAVEVDLRGAGVALCDIEYARECIGHVLDNARKFGGDKVTVDVMGSVLSITDSGAGIATDTLDKIGKPFFQGHDKTKFTGLGSGLGVYITKALMAAQGGEFTIASPGLDEGTTVVLSFAAPHGQSGNEGAAAEAEA